TLTGTLEGEPPATSNALESLAEPLVEAVPFCEEIVEFRSSTPPRPNEGSTNPVEAIFSELTVNLPSSGVSWVLAWLIGPTLPSSLKSPPPGSFAEMVTGNFEAGETLEATTDTSS